MTLGNLARTGLFFAIAAGFFFAFAVMLEVGLEEGFLCLVATAALLVTALPLAFRRHGNIFEPIWLVVLSVAIGVSGKAFYVCLGPQERVDFLLLDKAPQDLLPAALIMAVGLLCHSLGYVYGNVRWRLPSITILESDRWETKRLTSLVGILVVVGLLSFVLFTLRLDASFSDLSDLSSKRFVQITGSEHLGAQGYLRWGIRLIELAFYLVFAHWAATKRKLWSLLGVVVFTLALLAVAFPVFASSRRTIFFMVIRAIIIWICIRREPRPRYVAALVAAVLLVFGSMLSFRQGRSDLERIQQHVSVSGVLEVTVGGRYFLDLTKTAHIISAIPEKLDYQYGRTLLTWLVAPVPRALWPEKPAIKVGIELGPLVFRTNKVTGVPPGIISELYLNFGIPGVLAGMLTLGFFLSSLYATLRPRFPNKAAVLIYALASVQFTLDLLGGEVSGAVIAFLMNVIPLALALMLVSVPGQAASRP